MFRLQCIIAQGPNIQRKECTLALVEPYLSGHCRLCDYVYFANFARTVTGANTLYEDLLMITESCEL